MAYSNLASLTPSRPAPVPPSQYRPIQSIQPQQQRTNPSSSSRSAPSLHSNFSSTAYGSSFPNTTASSSLAPSSQYHHHQQQQQQQEQQQRHQSHQSTRNTVVRTGPAQVKEEGLRSFMWSKRWLVLGGSELQVFKNEVSFLPVVG